MSVRDENQSNLQALVEAAEDAYTYCPYAIKDLMETISLVPRKEVRDELCRLAMTMGGYSHMINECKAKIKELCNAKIPR